MKTFTFLLMSFMAFGSVSFAAPVDEVAARTAGTNFLKQRGIAVEIPMKMKETFSSRGEIMYYVFDNNGSGFVIVSADYRVVPVLAYSAQSVWDMTPDQVYGSNVYGWMQVYADQIQYVRDQDLPSSSQIDQQWESLLQGPMPTDNMTAVNPLLTTTWDQVWPYNEYCPADAGGSGGRALVGCVGVTIAQILKYWSAFPTGLGSYTYTQAPYGTITANFGATSYNWAGMPNSITASDPDIATLMFHSAVSCGSQFGPTATNVGWINDREPMSKAYINYFKMAYSSIQFVSRASYSTTDWENLIKAELEATPARPVHYRGDGVGSHQWVCDGYSGTNYFHFNFGWGGSYNGYYYLTSINPGTYNFTNNQQAIIGIKPNDGSTIIAHATWSGTQNKTTKTAIADGITLTLSPGANIKFTANTWLQVYGNINAIGTQADSITISAIDTTAGWLGIKLDNQYMDNTVMNDNDTSRFVYCRISYADDHAIYLSHINKIKINRSRIHNNYCAVHGGAIQSFESNLLVDNSRFHNNISAMTGGAINLGNSGANIEKVLNSFFTNNTSSTNGGAIFVGNCTPATIIEGCTLQYNTASSGGALALQAGSPMIRSNKFVNNTASGSGGAIYVTSSNAKSINDLIANNVASTGAGGGMQVVGNSNIVLTNTTIVNNYANTGGGGINFNSANAVSKNIIIYGNVAGMLGNQVALGTANCDPNFYYCDIQGGVAGFGGPGAGGDYSGIYEFNIDNDPGFVHPSDGVGADYDGLSADWQLNNSSLCIDAATPDTTGLLLPATDLAGNPRVWGGIVDMGAYEFNPVTIGESRLQAKTPARLVAAPNPFVHELSLTVTPKTGIPIRITVHNLLGREVARLLDQTDNRLAYTTLHWNGRGSAGENLPTGAYIISLVEDGKEVESLRVVKSGR